MRDRARGGLSLAPVSQLLRTRKERDCVQFIPHHEGLTFETSTIVVKALLRRATCNASPLRCKLQELHDVTGHLCNLQCIFRCCAQRCTK